jgi:hypothetical protein
MKTAELIGAALDWAVSKCEGFTSEYEPDIGDFWIERTNHTYTGLAPFGYLKEALHFSTDWSQGGPIIERELLTICALSKNRFSAGYAVAHSAKNNQIGTTPLIAAMRCYVASKLGDKVVLPKELENV